MMKCSFAAIGLFFSVLILQAFSPAPVHSKVDASVKKLAGGKLGFEFKVNTIGAIIINTEGPWQLKVKQAEHLQFSKDTLPRSEFNEKTPGFYLETAKAPAAKKGQLKYQLVSFICTKNKEQCFREVHDGTLDW